jgi:hypothetical protein
MTRFLTAIIFLFAAMISIVPQIAQAGEVEAGPIWNDSNARAQCPIVCDSSGQGQWDGHWRTTVPGQMSVCSCGGGYVPDNRRGDASNNDDDDGGSHRHHHHSKGWDWNWSVGPGDSNNAGNAASPGGFGSGGSCSTGASQTGSCSGCSVSCPADKQASCKQGQEWPGGSPTCMREAKCECK